MADQRRDSEQRPSPEALLEAARREERRVGRLKIFVGAAPGVGKTYEMLQPARATQEGRRRRRRRRRRDPRPQGDRGAARRASRSSRAGASTTRASRSRRWTSTPSSPAARRSSWSTSSPTPTRPAAAIPSAISTSRSCSTAGIDVYTTVNIQHIESLNDVVAQITRVRVRETVPDCDLRPRRRHRAGRPHARRPDPAAEGRQGLRPQAGRARARALLLARPT